MQTTEFNRPLSMTLYENPHQTPLNPIKTTQFHENFGEGSSFGGNKMIPILSHSSFMIIKLYILSFVLNMEGV